MTTHYEQRQFRDRRPTIGELHQDAGAKAHTAVVLLVILVLWGIVGEMDYRDALRAEAETCQQAAQAASERSPG